MADVSTETNVTMEWATWYGRASDLRKLVNDASRLAQTRRDQILELRYGGSLKLQRNASGILEIGATEDELRKLRDSFIARDFESQFRYNYGRNPLIVEIDDGTTRVYGSPDEVLKQLDERSVHVVRLRWSEYSEDFEVAVGKVGSGVSARLHVKSSAEEWARGAVHKLSHEIRKGVPWWDFLKRRHTKYLLGSSLGLASGLWTLALLHGGFSIGSIWTTGVSIAVGLAVFLIVSVSSVHDFLASPYVISDTDSRPNAPILLGLVGSSIVAVLLGVYVNFIS